MLAVSERHVSPETSDAVVPASDRSVEPLPPRPVAPSPDRRVRAAETRRLTKRALWRLSTAGWFGLSLLVLVTALALSSIFPRSPIPEVVALAGYTLFGLSTLIATYRGLRGILALAGLVQTPTSGGIDQLVDVLANLFMAGTGMLFAYLATFGFARGRQLRRFGRVLLPALQPDGKWTKSMSTLEGWDVPSGVADRWRENGKTEHASVAAFARLTLDLMALGAPPHLITAANQDALDEIRHTETCFSLARMLDGRSLGPAPFPQVRPVARLPRSRTLALAKLAVDSLVDGALHEGVSARIIARLARRCEVPAIREALKEIAADEGRHAAHGWAVMEWCLAEGGSPVSQALLGAIAALPTEMRSELPEGASNGEWERWGIHGHRLESEEYAAARAHLVQRVHVAASSRPRRVA